MRVPPRSSVLPPPLWTAETTRDSPVVERRALRDPMAKVDEGAPPGPTDMYIRTPTLFTRVTPPSVAGRADTSAQDTVPLAG
jgi:hypothetical protein